MDDTTFPDESLPVDDTTFPDESSTGNDSSGNVVSSTGNDRRDIADSSDSDSDDSDGAEEKKSDETTNEVQRTNPHDWNDKLQNDITVILSWNQEQITQWYHKRRTQKTRDIESTFFPNRVKFSLMLQEFIQEFFEKWVHTYSEAYRQAKGHDPPSGEIANGAKSMWDMCQKHFLKTKAMVEEHILERISGMAFENGVFRNAAVGELILRNWEGIFSSKSIREEIRNEVTGDTGAETHIELLKLIAVANLSRPPFETDDNRCIGRQVFFDESLHERIDGTRRKLGWVTIIFPGFLQDVKAPCMDTTIDFDSVQGT